MCKPLILKGNGIQNTQRALKSQKKKTGERSETDTSVKTY